MAVLVLSAGFAIISSGGDTKAKPANIAERARALIEDGNTTEAIGIAKREIAAHPDNGMAYAALGEAQLALGRNRDALASYESGILATPDLAGEPTVVASLSRIADAREPEIAIAALELIALRSGPQGHDVLATHASSGAIAEVRHRAFLLAEHAGITDRIDRVASWMLDLDQATTCEQRHAAISKLAGAGDRRALPALRAAKSQRCVERDAAAAIQRITTASKQR